MPDVLGLRDALTGERALLDPAVRGSREQLDRWLHPDFSEIGASGTRWSRDAIVDALLADPSCTSTMWDVGGRVLAPGVVHLTYTAASGERTTHRSSLWVTDAAGRWQLLFSQGTATGTKAT